LILGSVLFLVLNLFHKSAQPFPWLKVSPLFCDSMHLFSLTVHNTTL
jgi:hypothetical protein